jgi:hypothetical protein
LAWALNDVFGDVFWIVGAFKVRLMLSLFPFSLFFLIPSPIFDSWVRFARRSSETRVSLWGQF